MSCGTCSWWVTWRLGGRGGTKQSTTFPTHGLAEAANALCKSRNHRITDTEVYQAVIGITEDDITTPTLGEFADEWLKRRIKNKAAGESYPNRQASVIRRHITPRLGKLRLTEQDITPEVIADWVGWMGQHTNLQPPTIREIHGILYSVLSAAVPKWLSYNPAGVKTSGGRRKSNLPEVEPHEVVFLEPHEIDLIKSACPGDLYPLIITALGTGLRMGELVALQVDHVQLTGPRKVIRVRRALKKGGKIGSPKSRRSRRDVSLPDPVIEVLTPLLKGRRRDELVFTSPRGKMWNPSNLRNRHWAPMIAHAQRCLEHLPPLPEKTNKKGPRRGVAPGRGVHL